jgi:hypothetical protein
MPNRDAIVKAWLAAEQVAVAAERALAHLESPTAQVLEEEAKTARALRKQADQLFKQVYAAVKVEARP